MYQQAVVGNKLLSVQLTMVWGGNEESSLMGDLHPLSHLHTYPADWLRVPEISFKRSFTNCLILLLI